MPRQDKATPEWDERFRKAASDGLTVAELAERFGKTKGAVWNTLMRLGLKAAKDKREPSDGF